jgi:hypothetical protein
MSINTLKEKKGQRRCWEDKAWKRRWSVAIVDHPYFGRSLHQDLDAKASQGREVSKVGDPKSSNGV